MQAVIFDFDGLIIDSEGAHIGAWKTLFEENGATFDPALFHQIIGTSDKVFDPIGEIERLSGRTLPREELRLRHHHMLLDAMQTLEPLPGVRERIEEAKSLGLRLALASSSSSTWVLGHLHRLGLLRAFDAAACREEVPRTKPDPALYRLALSKIGINPESAIAFEDSHHGVTAARAAGLQVIAVPNEHTRGMDFSAATQVVTSLDAVTLAELRDTLFPR